MVRRSQQHVTGLRITHIGGPTVLMNVGGWHLLTDPTFDPPGRKYKFGWGTSSVKLAGPAIAPSDLPPIDAVLLTHDHHDDNLDPAGRALLPRAGTVVTTVSGATRLGRRRTRPRAVVEDSARSAGAAVDRDHRHAVPPRPAAEPSACRRCGRLCAALGWTGARRPLDLGRHGPLQRRAPGRQPPAGRHGAAAPRRRAVPGLRPAPLHDDRQGRVELCSLVRPRTVIPIHYEGWKHFREGRDAIERELAKAPEDIRRRIKWLPVGVEVEIAA